MSIGKSFLPEFDQEMATTRRVIERVPAEKGEWKPHPKSFAMGHLAQLVSRMPAWATSMMQTTELDIAPVDGPTQTYSFEQTEALLAGFDKGAAQARAAIAAASDDDFNETWTLKAAGNDVNSGTRYLMLRTVMLNHLVHHRAQLGVYLRLVDLPGPSMYGPTADDKE